MGLVIIDITVFFHNLNDGNNENPEVLNYPLFFCNKALYLFQFSIVFVAYFNNKSFVFAFQEKVTVLTSINATRDMLADMTPYGRVLEDQLRKVTQLKDLLEKLLALDPSKRIHNHQALIHPFITEKI